MRQSQTVQYKAERYRLRPSIQPLLGVVADSTNLLATFEGRVAHIGLDVALVEANVEKVQVRVYFQHVAIYEGTGKANAFMTRQSPHII